MTESTETPDAPAGGTEEHVTEHKHGGLGQLAATAICGNDITSSCLYVSALSIVAAGRWAPLALLIVAAVLFLFRSVYAEVVGALPLNGGAYNALLNTTSKFRASIAACLTILSYMATAVLSAHEAMHYAEQLWHSLPVMWATIGLLTIFMVLAIVGISESASVAIGIFITHLLTLTLLVIVGGYHIATTAGLETARANFLQPSAVELGIDPAPDESSGHHGGSPASATATPGDEPNGEPADEPANANDGDASSKADGDEAEQAKQPRRSWFSGMVQALFFGFAAALLGISGFESSANFVEEQAEGVFPKTLRNMWIAVSIFNPLMAVLALSLIPIAVVSEHKEELLAYLGEQCGGKWLAWIVSIDAVLVLSGAVLTSFVGVNGLVRRMTLDRCLPQFLLKTNRRGTTHRIIIAFFILCVSVLVITGGNVKVLAGVYTLSFLAVMILFGLGNVLLKVKRSKLPRPNRAAWSTVLVAIGAVAIGLIGNVIMGQSEDPPYLQVFLYYAIPAILVVAFMLGRIAILKLSLFIVRQMIAALIGPMHQIADAIRNWINRINSQQIVFFTRGDNIANLNAAMLYVRENEHTNRIKIVTVVNDPSQAPPRLAEDVQFLDEAYPEIDIEYVILEGQFGPELIQQLSDQWKIPKNLMFIGSPGDHFIYGLAELGGVRLII